jgi:hypothetical protein
MNRRSKATAWCIFAFVFAASISAAYGWYLLTGLGEMSDGGGGGYQPTLARTVWHCVPFVSLALIAGAFLPLLPMVFQKVLLLLSFALFEALALEVLPNLYVTIIPSAIAALIALLSWLVLTDLKDTKPNQLSEPTLASGTSPAGQEPRLR